MSLYMHKHAIERKSSFGSSRKRIRRSQGDSNSDKRICRIEELEKREYLAADPISVGVVYTEQYVENLGDKFYVAWVGGEDGCTTLDSLVIDLDKNQNGQLDEGEAFFDTEGGSEVYTYVPFTIVDKTSDIGYTYEVEDGGMTLKISFSNFHAGDTFVFCIDLDEYQPTSTSNAQVEGSEMGGSIVHDVGGSFASASFSSDHYQTETWVGMFVDDYDNEYTRYEDLDDAYVRSLLPYDLDDNNEGISQAGIYDQFTLTPKPIVISGYVYADLDVDCDYEPQDGDLPLSNVEVTLYDKDGKTWTTTTDVNGYYEFKGDDLLPNEYKIISQSNIVSPEGYQYVDFCAKGGEYGEKITPLEIDVTGMDGGDLAPNNNFAKVLPASISGYVFEDFNDNGVKDEGESWDGERYQATVELYRVDSDENGNKTYTLMETQTVDEEGFYEFKLDCSYNEAGTLRKLPGRTYEIREVFSSSDYSDGKDHVGSLGGNLGNDVISEVFVGYDQHGVHYDFGEVKLGSIAGNVYEDRNDNGIIDPKEKGIAEVTIELFQWDGSKYVKIAETKTDENGSYIFENLDILCDYAVKELQPSEYNDGKDSTGTLGGKISDDYQYDVNIGWDQHGTEYNFGELKLGSITGNVYEDRNDDGDFGEDENGIENVVVELYRWNGNDYEYVRETRTDTKGAYKFDNLDINEQYAVRERQPEGYTDGKDSVGSLGGEKVANDEIRSIDVQWDLHGINYNFGELKLGSISGYVYHDSDNDGKFETDEDSISGVTVELYRLNDGQYVLESTTTTDEQGYYKFDNLDINQTYAVKELQPSGWINGKNSIGTLGGTNSESDLLDNIRVLWDQQGEQYNFGELKPGSISGHVYEDTNDNGLIDDGEKMISGVIVSLWILNEETGKYDDTGRSVETDSEGYYIFDDLEPNRIYRVVEIQPSNYNDGKDSVGTLGGNASVNDEFSSIEVMSDDHGTDYNFGELRPIEDTPTTPDKPDSGVPSRSVNVPNNTWGVNPTSFPYMFYQPTIPGSMTTLYGGGGGFVETYSWHLSTLNDAAPKSNSVLGWNEGFRKDLRNEESIASGEPVKGGSYVQVSQQELGQWILRELDSDADETVYWFGKPGSKAVIGDWNGDGKDKIGIFNNGRWELDRNGDGVWDVDDIMAEFSVVTVNDQPVTGDWDGDGKTDIGVFGPNWSEDSKLLAVEKGLPTDNKLYTVVSYGEDKNSENSNTRETLLNNPASSMRTVARNDYAQDRYDLIDHVFRYGNEGSIALTGDWTGDGIAKIGYYNNGELYLDMNGNGAVDAGEKIVTGIIGDDYIPVVGDWNGSGIDTVGFFRNGEWLIDANSDGSYEHYELGQKGDQPVVGDWDGDGIDEIGVYREKGVVDVDSNSSTVTQQSVVDYSNNIAMD